MDKIKPYELGKIRGRLEAKVDDFVKYVHPIFDLKGWEYHDGPPSPSRLEKVCYSVIGHLESGHTEYIVSRGRIKAFYKRKKTGIISYGLKIDDSTFVETDIF